MGYVKRAEEKSRKGRWSLQCGRPYTSPRALEGFVRVEEHSVRDREKEADAEGALACMSALAGTGLTCLHPITSCMDRPMAASSCKSLGRNES